MKIEHTKVYNFDGAFRGMRNPLESWGKSDSAGGYGNIDILEELPQFTGALDSWLDSQKITRDISDFTRKTWLKKNSVLENDENIKVVPFYCIGKNDMDLAQRLVKGGTEHAKFLRQIEVCVDVTAPLYWWKEYDTYKVATTANSTSTMHKLSTTPITIDCFEIDDFNEELMVFGNEPYDYDVTMAECAERIIDICETLRCKYIETRDIRYWKELIRWLPEGWLQTRTVTLNYATLRNMYFQRRHHKLSEWKTFCGWIETLPYAKELICLE